MARPSSPPSAAAAPSAAKPIFKNTGKLFQPFHAIGVRSETGEEPGVYNCNGLQATITGEGRPTFISLNDRATTPAETRSYSVKQASVSRLDENFMEDGTPLTHEEGEALCAEIAERVESTRLEIKEKFSTDGSPTISDDDVNFFLRSEILAKHKEKMIPLIRNAMREDERLTFREAVTQLRTISDEQLFAILNLEFDYKRVLIEAPQHLAIQYLEEAKERDSTANLATIFETLVSMEPHKFYATCLGFSQEFIDTVEADKTLHLDYLIDLKYKLSSEGKSPKTTAAMLEILEQTAAFTNKNQFRGLLLGLDVELAIRLTGDELADSVHLQYLTNEVVGNRRISELPDEEKTKAIGEIFTSIEGCENYPQCIAKRELGFSDEIIHTMVEDEDDDLKNINFVVSLKARKPSLTVDELVITYSRIRHFNTIQFNAASLGLPLEIAETIRFDRGEVSYLKKLKRKNSSISEEELAATYQKLTTFSNSQFRATILGLPLEIAETYFGDTTQANTWFRYLQNFKAKNPETTDEEITAKFNEIRPLKSELQLRVLDIGLSPSSAKKFTIHSLYERKIWILEDLKEMRPDITDQQLEDFCTEVLRTSDELLSTWNRGIEIGLNPENVTQLTDKKNLAHFKSLEKFIGESPDEYLDAEAINAKFSELLRAGLDAPATDAAVAGATVVAPSRPRSNSSPI